METLIVHDNDGYLISLSVGDNLRTPSGVPYILEKIPEGKQIKITDGICVDVSVTPHQVILEDIPPSDIEVLKNRTQDLELMLAEFIMGGF